MSPDALHAQSRLRLSNAASADTVDEMIDRIGKMFTPSTPVSDAAIFTGRAQQIRALSESLCEPGRHVILYGERGVGKTSLSRLAAGLPNPFRRVVHVRKVCAPTDDFSSIWRKLFHDLAQLTGHEYTQGSGPITPDAIVRHLQSGAARDLPVLVIDEFNEVADEATGRLLANTIKIMSDEGLAATIIVVGLQGDLISKHPSISRCVDEILVPRMSDEELTALIEMRLAPLGMTIQATAETHIVVEAQGFPAQAHRLAKLAAIAAVRDNRTTILEKDVTAALNQPARRSLA